MNNFFQTISKTTLLVCVIIIVVGIYGISTYNGFVSKSGTVDARFADVDVNLKRRFDLIPNLEATVKGVAAQEKEVLSAIANARTGYAGARTNEDKIKADNQFSGALSRLLVIQEQYPQLKSNEAFQSLMVQLEGTENRIAVSRKDYNDATLVYNNSVKKFPANIVASVTNFKAKIFFETPLEQKETPKIDFKN